jgi:hypothetical protein
MTEDSAARRQTDDWPELLRNGDAKEQEYKITTFDGRKLDVLVSVYRSELCRALSSACSERTPVSAAP